MSDTAPGRGSRQRKAWRADPVLTEITDRTELPDHFPGAAALRAAGLRTYFDVFRTPPETLARIEGLDAHTARELARMARPR